jgi:predicted Ser/Thr protein kinase
LVRREEKLDDFKKIKVIRESTISLMVDNPTELKLIGKGAHGAVYKLAGDKCVKLYADKHNAEKEAGSYRIGQSSEIVPRLYEVGENYIIMEFIEGISLWKYISIKNEISYDITKKILHLLKEMRRLGFTRIDSSLRHIIITKDEKLKVIDLVYAYVRVDKKPIKIFTELSKLGLAKQFMSHVKTIDQELYNEWNSAMSEYLQ